MAGQQRLEHVGYRVMDLDEAVTFYTEVMGLVEMDRIDGTVYLGCGLDENFDIAVSEGGTGADYFGIRLDTAAELDEYEERLSEEGIETRRVGDRPNVDAGLRVSMPMGVDVELVTVADPAYHHADEDRLGGRSPIAPANVDHITLGSTDLEANVAFLRDHLDFRVSEVIRKEDGDWQGAFLRRETHHHDVAILERPPEKDYTMRHVAWEMVDLEHMKTVIDTLANAGHQLEVCIHRHYVGNNLAAYFWSPCGNRFELCAEMATLDPTTPTAYNDPGEGFTAWGGVNPPDSYFEEGS